MPVVQIMLTDVADNRIQGLTQGVAQSTSSLLRAAGPFTVSILFSYLSAERRAYVHVTVVPWVGGGAGLEAERGYAGDRCRLGRPDGNCEGYAPVVRGPGTLPLPCGLGCIPQPPHPALPSPRDGGSGPRCQRTLRSVHPAA
jgi:hypothetical protein